MLYILLLIDVQVKSERLLLIFCGIITLSLSHVLFFLFLNSNVYMLLQQYCTIYALHKHKTVLIFKYRIEGTGWIQTYCMTSKPK